MEKIKVTKTEEKYLEILKELHRVLQTTSNISVSKFEKSAKASRYLMKILSNGKVIINEGNCQRPEWKWNTIYPNIYMAKKTVAELNALHQSLNKKDSTVEPFIFDSAEPVPIPVVATQEEVVIPSKTKKPRGAYTRKPKKGTLKMYQVRLLFGLIKINIIPIWN